MKEDKSSQYGYGEIKFRAQHGQGLSLDKVRVLGDKVTGLRLRDKYHEKMAEILEDAGIGDDALALAETYEKIASAVGVRISNPEAIRGGGYYRDLSDVSLDALDKYSRWYAACKAKHLSPKMCFQVVVECWSFNQCDAEHKFREGTARKQVVECLKIWNATK